MNLDTLRRDIPVGLVVFLVVTSLSSSRFAVSGPAAGLVTIVVASMVSLGSFSAFLTALIIAGALQCLFGLMRAGRFISLVPGSLIKGMLAAIGLLLIMQQIPVALGAAGDVELISLVNGEMTFSLLAMLVVGIGLAILLAVDQRAGQTH